MVLPMEFRRREAPTTAIERGLKMQSSDDPLISEVPLHIG
jgi:hypothetical protein